MKKVETIKMVQSDLFCRAEYLEEGKFKITDIYGDFYSCFGYTYGETIISDLGHVTSQVYDEPIGEML